MRITAGPGDSATWAPYTGHPNDPRTNTVMDGVSTDGNQYTKREQALLNWQEYGIELPKEIIEEEAQKILPAECALEINCACWFREFARFITEGSEDFAFRYFRDNLIDSGRSAVMEDTEYDYVVDINYLIQAVKNDNRAYFAEASAKLLHKAAGCLALSNLEFEADKLTRKND